MKKIAITAVALTSVALLAGMWAGPVPGGSNLTSEGGETEMPPKSPQVAGTWFSTLTVVDANGVPIPGADVNSIATYTFKGGVTLTDTTDAGSHFLFAGLDSPSHGAWTADGDDLTTVLLAINYDAAGVHTGFSRITANQKYDPLNKTVAVGTWFAEVFDVGEDPLGPPRQPVAGGGVISRKLVINP